MVPGNSTSIFDLSIEPEDNHTPPLRFSDAWLSVRTIAASTSRFESRLLDDVRCHKRELLRDKGQVDIMVLASKLATVGYKVTIRTAMGGGRGQRCFRNLCHEFLLVSSFDTNSVQLVVDPSFREQFAISQSTWEYEKLLSLVPSEFVGTPARLKPLVKLLCLEMEQTFQEKGLTWPPWRQAKSVISKWLPAKMRDTYIASTSSSLKASSAEGGSPTGPLGFCSSRSSSLESDSPDHLQTLASYTMQPPGCRPSPRGCRHNSTLLSIANPPAKASAPRVAGYQASEPAFPTHGLDLKYRSFLYLHEARP